MQSCLHSDIKIAGKQCDFPASVGPVACFRGRSSSLRYLALCASFLTVTPRGCWGDVTLCQQSRLSKSNTTLTAAM